MANSQLDIIINLLRTWGKLDNFYCFENKITLRLGARIYDLQKLGWRFKTYKDPNNKKNYIYQVIRDPDQPIQLSLI